MIFFDIDDTLLDNQGAEIAAAIEFHQLYSHERGPGLEILFFPKNDISRPGP